MTNNQSEISTGLADWKTPEAVEQESGALSANQQRWLYRQGKAPGCFVVIGRTLLASPTRLAAWIAAQADAQGSARARIGNARADRRRAARAARAANRQEA